MKRLAEQACCSEGDQQTDSNRHASVKPSLSCHHDSDGCQNDSP